VFSNLEIFEMGSAMFVLLWWLFWWPFSFYWTFKCSTDIHHGNN